MLNLPMLINSRLSLRCLLRTLSQHFGNLINFYMMEVSSTRLGYSMCTFYMPGRKINATRSPQAKIIVFSITQQFIFFWQIFFVSPSYFGHCQQASDDREPCPVLFCRDMNPRYSLSKKSKMGKNCGGQPLDGC